MTARYAWIANNFLHDVASGLWAACLFVIWRLAYYRGAASTIPPAAEVLRGVSHELFVVMLLSLAVIAVTGGFRLRYWRRQGTPDELPYLIRTVALKHVVYLLVYGAGTAWAWVLQG